MRKSFYFKLAFTNLRKNKNTYFPYILICTCAVATFYTIMAIFLNPGLDQMQGAASLKVLLQLGSVVIGIFSVILLFYTNGFLLKRRNKELGLYSILGMEKRHISKLLFCENILVALISLVVGLLGGILVSKLLFLLLLNILEIQSPIQFTVSATALLTAFLLFSAIFLLTLVRNLWHVKTANPIALLSAGKQGEREPKANWPLALIGFAALIAGYWMAQTVDNPIDALTLFFLAVLLVILGTYCLFTAGSIVVLKLLRRNKKFYYRPKNFVSVSGMLYRMKQNAVGLANICILSTMVLVVISTTVCLYIGKEEGFKNQYPYDLSISCYSAEDQEKLAGIFNDTLKNYYVTAESELRFRDFQFAAYRKEDGVYANNDSEGVDMSSDSYSAIALVPLEDYNRITGEAETLGDGEALLYGEKSAYGRDRIRLGDRELAIKREVSEFFTRGPQTVISQTLYLVVKDAAAVQEIAKSFMGGPEQPIIYNFACDLEGTQEQSKAFTLELKSKLSDQLNGYRMSSRQLFREEWLAMNGGFLFLGLFLGFLFMIATVLIIYYKQISEGFDDHDRFKIMQDVGMSHKEVKSTIRKQILMVFFLPLAAAVLHVAFAFHMIRKLLLIFGLMDVSLFLICTAATVLIFGIFYGVVYSLTAKTYYKLVQRV